MAPPLRRERTAAQPGEAQQTLETREEEGRGGGVKDGDTPLSNKQDSPSERTRCPGSYDRSDGSRGKNKPVRLCIYN